MAGRTGTVWFGNRLVGRLREDSGRNMLFCKPVMGINKASGCASHVMTGPET